jgi:hypothetical protein
MGEQRTQDEQRQQESPLKTERGSTTIQDGVVYKISGMATEEVDGVRMGGGGTSEAVGGAPGCRAGLRRRKPEPRRLGGGG